MCIPKDSSVVEFSYVKGRPRATVQLKVPGQSSKYFEMLIDSGSDHTIISQNHALELGIDYDKVESREVITEVANLTNMETKEVRIQLILGDIEITIPIMISKEATEPLLGRKGVFDRFDVLFQQRKNTVTFTRV